MNRYIKKVCSYTYVSAYTHQVKLPNKAASEMVLAHNYHMKPEHFFPKTSTGVRKIHPFNGYQYPAGSLVGTNQSLSKLSLRYEGNVRIQHVY